MEHVRENHIGYADAAGLMKLASDNNRVGDLKQALLEWVDACLDRLQAEENARLARDEESLSPTDWQLKKYLTREQVNAWREDLEKGEPLGKPTFKFRALIAEEQGRQVIKLDGLSKAVDQMTPGDLAKVYARLADFTADLEPIMKRKAAEEEHAHEPEAVSTPAKVGAERLRALGLGKYASSIYASPTSETDGRRPGEDAGEAGIDGPVEGIVEPELVAPKLPAGDAEASQDRKDPKTSDRSRGPASA
jgi:hypothetical protein